MSGWINFKNKKPDDLQNVFVCNILCPSFGYFEAVYHKEGYFICCALEKAMPIDVTHWMPTISMPS
jgi:hypothetical protein